MSFIMGFWFMGIMWFMMSVIFHLTVPVRRGVRVYGAGALAGGLDQLRGRQSTVSVSVHVY